MFEDLNSSEKIRLLYANNNKMGAKLGEESGVEEYENAVALTGFGRYNYGLLIVSGACLMSCFIEILSMAYIVPAAQCDLDLSLSEKSVLSSIGFCGVVFSCLLWGFIGDIFGRRKMMVITTFLSALFGFASSFVPFVWLFILFRFLNGFFIGCPMAVSIAYLGEFHCDKYRAKVILWAGALSSLASVMLPALAWLVLSMNWEFPITFFGILMRPWRLLVILNSTVTLLTASYLLCFPESPKYLWSTGKHEQSLAILRNMYVVNTRNQATLYPISSFSSESSKGFISSKNSTKSSVMKSAWIQLSPLFRMPLLPRTIITSILQFGILSGSNGVYMWFPDIFNRIFLFMTDYPNKALMFCDAMTHKANVTNVIDVSAANSSNCSDVANELTFLLTLIVGSTYAILYIILGFIVNIFGAKLLIVVFLLISSLSGIAMHYVEGHVALTFFMGIFFVNGLCINLIQSIIVDIFPTQNRAMAISIAQMIGRIGAVIGSYTMGIILVYYCSYTFFICAFDALVIIIGLLFLPTPLIPSRLKCK